MAANRITELFLQEGQSAWQDDISREAGTPKTSPRDGRAGDPW